MLSDPSCIFCKIIKGDIPSARVYENERVLAFMDIAPVNPGHVLVIPKRHALTLLDLDIEDARACMDAIHRIAPAVLAATGWPGFNVLQNNHGCAGQVVRHCHFHLIPRSPDDGFHFGWRQGQYAAGEIEQLRQKIADRVR